MDDAVTVKMLADGLMYTHSRLNDATKKYLESSSFLYALIEMLIDKGIVDKESLDSIKLEMSDRLIGNFKSTGLGMLYQDSEFDKYSYPHQADVDCRSRVSICKASCCRLPFALSRQDVEEGIVRWEFGRPYMIAHTENNYCVHLNEDNYQCSVHSHRPVPCQGFDCRDNKKWKIWKDFSKKSINPEFEGTITESNLKFYQYKPSL